MCAVGDEAFEIYADPDAFSEVREALEAQGIQFVQADVELVPTNTITLDKPEDREKMRKLLDALEDNDDVQNVYHNWENDDEE